MLKKKWHAGARVSAGVVHFCGCGRRALPRYDAGGRHSFRGLRQKSRVRCARDCSRVVLRLPNEIEILLRSREGSPNLALHPAGAQYLERSAPYSGILILGLSMGVFMGVFSW
jgi:hypothetical protein